MPHKDLGVRRKYQREYSRKRRTKPERILYMQSFMKQWLVRIKAKEYQHLIKVRTMMHYSNPMGVPICNNCGEQDIDVLCIDHINGDGAKHRKQLGVVLGTAFYQWLSNNNHPEGFQVLCWNCNHKKRLFEQASLSENS